MRPNYSQSFAQQEGVCRFAWCLYQFHGLDDKLYGETVSRTGSTVAYSGSSGSETHKNLLISVITSN